jgi:hypothetical protein
MPGLFILKLITSTDTAPMKLILLTLFFLCLSALTHGKDCDPNDEIKELSCFIQDISKKVLEQKEVVPHHIYHFGKKPILDNDIAAGTIKQADWDKFIMGDQTRYQLGSVRRGLYGTGGVDSNEFFADSYNWLIDIKIKDECRKPSRVVDLSHLEEDPRFINWFKKKARDINLSSFGSKCIITDDNYQGYNSNDCEELVTDFLKETKVAIVQDHIIEKSFYIRDRSCIEKITGSPDDWVDVLASRPNLWLDRCGNMNLDSLPALLFHSLPLMKKPFTKSTRDQIVKNFDLSLVLVPERRKLLTEMLDAKLRCETQGKDDFNQQFKDVSNYPLNVFPYAEFEKICP